METKISKIILLLLLIVLASISINAFAVSMPYMPDKTLILYPGASSDFELILQNMVGESDEMAQVTIEDGNEIAKIVDKENVYNVPKGTKDTKVHIQVDIPKNATLGTEWKVRFNTVLVTEREGGMVQVAGGVSDYFKVRAGSIPAQLPKEKHNLPWIMGGIILAGAIVFLILYKNKGKGKKKKHSK